MLALLGGLVVPALTPGVASASGVSGEIASDTTWSGQVVVAGNITVDPGATLSLNPGTSLLMEPNVSITVGGTLRSLGSAAFGNFIERANPNAAWGSIHAAPNSTLYVLNTVIDGGGQVGASFTDGQVVCDGCRASFHSGAIRHGALSGLRLSGSANVAVDEMGFTGNVGDGIHAVAFAPPNDADNFKGSLYVWGSEVIGTGGIAVDQGSADIERTIVSAGDGGAPLSSPPPTVFPSLPGTSHLPSVSFGSVGAGQYTLNGSDLLGGGVELDQGSLQASGNLLTGPLVWDNTQPGCQSLFNGVANYISNPGGYALFEPCINVRSASSSPEPQFVDAANFDFHQQPGSPGLGAGALGVAGTTVPPYEVGPATLTVSPPGPVTVGAAVTLWVQVTLPGADVPTGTVTFYDGPLPQSGTPVIGTAAIDPGTGRATFTTDGLSAGPHLFSVLAQSSADPVYSSSFTAPAGYLVLPGPLDHLVATPAAASIPAGGSQTYRITGFDAFGDNLGDQIPATLSVAPDGTCTGLTCSAATAGDHTVTASAGGKSVTAALHINAGPLSTIVLSPATTSILAGGSQAYRAEGYDAYRNDLGDVTTATTLSIDAGSCDNTTRTCTSSQPGDRTVTGADGLATGTATLTVTAPADQTITWTSLPGAVGYGNAPIGVSATATSGLPVTVSASGACAGMAISPVSVTITGAGDCSLTASQAGSAGYLPATASASVLVTPAPLQITASSSTVTYGGTVPTVTASYGGFVNGDNPASLTTPPTCSTTATVASPVGGYPSVCSGAVDPNYTISYSAGSVAVTPAGTTVAYTGPQQISVNSSFVPTATLTGATATCTAGQPVSFSLNTNPVTGVAGAYKVDTATANGSGVATGASVSTSSWQNGAYAITVAFAGTANCAPSSVTIGLSVITPGQAAAAAGSYNLAGPGPVSFGFLAAATNPTKSAYTGALTLVAAGKWWLQASVSSYAKVTSTQGAISGTGSLYWWNPALGRSGGWQLAKSGVAYTANFTATAKSSPGTFGISINYSPAAPQPSTLPNSGPQNLTKGQIFLA